MEPITYQPEGDPYPHLITVRLVREEGPGLGFEVDSDEEVIGEVDVDLVDPEHGFVSGVGPGERINNGYLLPASRAIAAFLHERDPAFDELRDFEDEQTIQFH